MGRVAQIDQSLGRSGSGGARGRATSARSRIAASRAASMLRNRGQSGTGTSGKTGG